MGFDRAMDGEEVPPPPKGHIAPVPVPGTNWTPSEADVHILKGQMDSLPHSEEHSGDSELTEAEMKTILSFIR